MVWGGDCRRHQSEIILCPPGEDINSAIYAQHILEKELRAFCDAGLKSMTGR